MGARRVVDEPGVVDPSLPRGILGSRTPRRGFGEDAFAAPHRRRGRRDRLPGRRLELEPVARGDAWGPGRRVYRLAARSAVDLAAQRDPRPAHGVGGDGDVLSRSRLENATPTVPADRYPTVT